MRKILQTAMIVSLLGCASIKPRCCNYAPLNSVGQGQLNIGSRTYRGPWRYYDERYAKVLYIYESSGERIVNPVSVEIEQEDYPTHPFDGR